jgi:predicted nuclease of restriction endonuclease-like (RecB) superfamily
MKQTNTIPQGYKHSPLGIIPEDWAVKKNVSFEELTALVKQIHLETQACAIKAINQFATVRNWLIGYYIVEYEQNGNDRAAYGDRLLQRLEERVDTKGLNETLFKVARTFYLYYPQIKNLLTLFTIKKSATLSHELSDAEIPASIEKGATPLHEWVTPPHALVSRLSFSHIREMLTISDPVARFFYETECMKCCWSVRELRRQINTNLFVRCGMSKNPQKLLSSLVSKEYSIADEIKQPFAFEFLGLRAKEVVEETDIEQALIEHLQDFLLEMGKGFCFEARQKRIIIDDEYYFADLVFYHRVLHCNVIIELKNDEFKHEYLGQLNAYVSYFRENEMYEGDRPPVGILLCTHKGKKMVEYAIAGLDNHLFVSTYLLQLPKKEEFEQFLINQTNNRL